jgi:aspartate oxidase
MKAIHENAELAPRDIVARTIAYEIAGQEQPFVYLTLDHLNPKRYVKIPAHFRKM